MKTKLLILTSVMLICLCLFTLTACEEPHEHSYKQVVTHPTCTEQGFTTNTCECGDEFIDTCVNALSHDLTHHESKQVACTDIGYEEYYTCSRCAYTTYQVIPATGHSDGEWITDIDATCTEDGSKHQVCSVCETTIKTETISKLGHTDGEWITDTDATCTEDGSKHQVCSVCETTIKTETISNLGGHRYSEFSLENNGVVGSNITYKCNNCISTYQETVKEIVVSIQHTGTSSSTMNGYGSYSKFYKATAQGGYGNYQYKFEVYTSSTATKPSTNLTKNFSSSNSYGISYRGYENAISGYILQVTVMDEAGNQTVYRYTF